MTVIVVTHRLHHIIEFDKVAIIESGRLGRIWKPEGACGDVWVAIGRPISCRCKERDGRHADRQLESMQRLISLYGLYLFSKRYAQSWMPKRYLYIFAFAKRDNGISTLQDITSYAVTGEDRCHKQRPLEFPDKIR
jgi:ABC-type multidrug transport system ATPase subunit